MLKIACERLKTEIETLGLFTKSAGLVQKVERKVQVDSDGRTIDKIESYPVSADVSGSECWENGLYKQLVPNSADDGMFYFEFVRGMQISENRGGIITYEGRARLVCWYNIKKFNLNDSTAGNESISFYIRAAINNLFFNRSNIKRLQHTHPLFSIPIHITASEITQLEGTKEIFRKYSYMEEMEPFVMYPYEVIASDYDIRLQYSQGCLQSIIKGTEQEC